MVRCSRASLRDHDDVEFGAGAVLAAEVQSGRRVHVVVCSRGEAATHGTPAERETESRARLWGARGGVAFAVALFPADPMVFSALPALGRGARRF